MPDIWMDVDTAIEVPVNIVPIVALADGYTIDETIAYNESGMDLNWNFYTTAGVASQTNITPTTGDDHDFVHEGNGMYSIEIPASGGDANNDTEGFGWVSWKADAILPARGPVIGLRKASMNDLMIDDGTAQDNMDNMFDGSGYAGGTIKLETDVQEVDGTAQRAADLAEISEFLISTTCTLTDKIADGSIIARLLASGGDISDYVDTTDSLEAIRDHIGDGTNLTEAGGDGDHLTESGGTGDQLTAINLPNQTMDIVGSVTGNLIGDVTGNVDGTVAGVTPEAAGVAPTAVENRQEMDSNSTELAKIGTIPALDGGGQTIGAAIAKLADDNGGATYDAGEDSLNKIRDDRTLAAADYVVVGDTIAGVTSVTDVAGDVKGNVDGTVAGVTPEAAGVAPLSAETIIMYIDDIKGFTESFVAYLDSGETISSFTIEADDGLTIVSSSNSTPFIAYVIQADGLSSGGSISLRQVKIVVTTSASRVETRFINFSLLDSDI